MNEYFSWYPGHVAKALREFKDKWLPLIDLVVEVVDSRVFSSAKYPEIEIFGSKKVITVFSKGDLCNLKEINKEAFVIDSHKPDKWKAKFKRLFEINTEQVKEKLERQGRKRNLRIGICGFPNTGKSSFLNALLKSGKKAKTGSLPGVTRTMQFVKNEDFDLLDTPGVCPVKLDRERALKLTLCGLLPEKLFQEEELIDYLRNILLSKNIEIKDDKYLIRKFRQGEFGICLDQ